MAMQKSHQTIILLYLCSKWNDFMAAQLTDCKVSISNDRLASLDVLRGFDMFWIVGGGTFVLNLINYLGRPCLEPIKANLEHADWVGFHAWDLIFPLFIFISGVTMPFSFAKHIAANQKGRLYLRIIKRAIILILLGLLYNNLLKTLDFANLRYLSVLGLIGLSYLWAAIVVINFKPLGQAVCGAVILIVYYLLMNFVTVPGFDAVDLTKAGGNFASYIDRLIVPGKLIYGATDPEGILMNFPACVLAIAGALTGSLLKNQNVRQYRKCLYIAAAGLACLAVGRLWAMHFPMIKKLWTSSFVVYATGWALLLTALFYLVVDVWQIRKIFFPFMLIGVNPITIYLGAHKVINFSYTAEFFFGGLIKIADEPLKPVILWTGILLCEFAFLYILYRKKIFLKV
jgi:predicted acyltransferase